MVLAPHVIYPVSVSHRGKDEWLRDLDARQRNVVFPDTAENEARLWRNIISGKGRLSPVQIIGISLVCLTLAAVVYSYISDQLRFTDIQGSLWERVLGTFGDWFILFGAAAVLLLIIWAIRFCLRLSKTNPHDSRKA